MVADVLIQSRQLEAQAREQLYDKIARRIDYYQQRNALARLCHTRATIRKLHRIGITLTELPRCEENTS